MWDFITGKLKKDLQFQADEQFMMHDEAVLALSFSKDSELLVSGSQDGKIKACHITIRPPCVLVKRLNPSAALILRMPHSCMFAELHRWSVVRIVFTLKRACADPQDLIFV